MNRKEFLQTSLMGAAAVAASTTGASLLTSCAPKNDTPLRISFQEGTAPGKTLEEKFDYMENLGIVGYEPGGWNLAARVNEFHQALKGRNIKISAICAGFQGFLLAEDPAVKAQFDSTMRDIIAAAGEIGSTGV
ncbi:MAG: sugar phosphate isomerase/epimerase, partial [Alistipes sp.]|nr:sugar phosphate isomerase/epimerase [Alistipes sp.]